MIISEYPNSSLWDMDYERLLHSKKTLPGTVGSYKPSSPFRSSSLLSYHRRRSLLSQNLGQKPQEKHLSCEVCLEFFRYGLMDTLGPSLAWNLSWFYSCDQEASLPKIHISALKVVQHKVKPFLLYKLLQLLGNMGVLSQAQQPKAFPLLQKQMIKPRKTPLKPKEERSGRYTRRRCGFGISNAFWCWLMGTAGPGEGGHRWVQPGTGGSCTVPGAALSATAERQLGLGCSSRTRSGGEWAGLIGGWAGSMKNEQMMGRIAGGRPGLLEDGQDQ